MLRKAIWSAVFIGGPNVAGFDQEPRIHLAPGTQVNDSTDQRLARVWNVLGADINAWRGRIYDLAKSWTAWILAEPAVAGAFAMVGALMGLGFNHLVGPKRFVASAGIEVANGSSLQLPSVLSSLAAGAGVQLGGNAPPLAFQSAILASQPLQDSVLVTRMPAPSTACRDSRCIFLDVMVEDNEPLSERLAVGRRRLNKYLDVVRDEQSQIIFINYSNPDSTFARLLVARLVERLDDVNKALTASTADARVAFLSAQLPFLRKQLQLIQDSLESFYVSNRVITNSPALQFRERRLRGEFESQLQLVESVRQQIAASEIQARGGVQVIEPVVPVSVDPKPYRPLRNVAFILGVLLVCATRWSWRNRGGRA